jgi:hypothetical protein
VHFGSEALSAVTVKTVMSMVLWVGSPYTDDTDSQTLPRASIGFLFGLLFDLKMEAMFLLNIGALSELHGVTTHMTHMTVLEIIFLSFLFYRQCPKVA